MEGVIDLLYSLYLYYHSKYYYLKQFIENAVTPLAQPHPYSFQVRDCVVK
jgi:hypothetical protein